MEKQAFVFAFPGNSWENDPGKAYMDSILNLPKEYGHFNPGEKGLFDMVYSFSVSSGRVVIPHGLKTWAIKQFGSLEAVETQEILRITNKLTLESTLFNGFRASRPTHSSGEVNLDRLIEETLMEPFAEAGEMTPEDRFGRIIGPHDMTASNIAKYDSHHGLVIFDNPDPIHFSQKELTGHFTTALKWIAAANQEDPGALYPVIAWNALWKAGASRVHGHLHVLLARGEPYPAMHLFKKIDDYMQRSKRFYFETLFLIHYRLGLGMEKHGVRVFAHITPKKEKEIILISHKADNRLFSAIHRVLGSLTKDLGVESFNLAVMMPPLDQSWGSFPVITRIVDRGPLSERTTDVASMELLLNQSVVAGDPVAVWAAVKSAL